VVDVFELISGILEVGSGSVRSKLRSEALISNLQIFESPKYLLPTKTFSSGIEGNLPKDATWGISV
jgi:hypothetical protein